MENFLFVGLLAVIYTVTMLICPYVVLIVLANLSYRLAAGRYFRWLSWRTMLPLGALLVGGLGFFFYAIYTGPSFLITH